MTCYFPLPLKMALYICYFYDDPWGHNVIVQGALWIGGNSPLLPLKGEVLFLSDQSTTF